MNVQRNLLAAVAAVGLIGTGAALRSGSSVASANPDTNSSSAAASGAFGSGIPTDGTIANVAERTMDSVVQIAVSGSDDADANPMAIDPSDLFGNGGDSPMMMGKGSGVIVNASGRILTNAHVVNGFKDIKVTLSDGSEYDAKVVGKDPKADLAVVQLQGTVPTLKPIPWGDSSKLRLGEIVLAVGDGLGVGKSVSMGIVSGKNRMNVGIEQYEDFIQTDAAINPGNSGGALVNLRGELIGINTAIASRSGGSQGIGFAIPANMARPLMDMLVTDGKITRGYLGVHIATANQQLAKKQGLGATRGVAVSDVEADGPAGKAHLQSGDVITALDGQPVDHMEALRNTIAMTKPGTTVALDVVHRNGRRETLKVKVGQLSDAPAESQSQSQLPGGFQVPRGWKCQRTRNGIQCQGGNGFGQTP